MGIALAESKSRLRVTGLPRWKVVLGALAPATLSVAICVLVGFDVDRTIGVSGSVLAVATFILSQWQTSGTPSRRVVMIPKSRSPFSLTVHRGVGDALAAFPSLTFTTEWPSGNTSDEVSWQIARLQSRDVLSADAVIILPGGDQERLWDAIARMSRAGQFVVVVDTKPANSFFALRQAPRPCFVGSDFSMGGDLVGAEIVRRLVVDRGARAVILCGPDSSWPGMERSRGIVHRLALAGMNDRVTCEPLESWNREAGAILIVKAVLATLSGGCSAVIAFCGNDKILDAAERSLVLELRREDRGRVQLIGYDGVTSGSGDFLVQECSMGVATVDTKPKLQGAAIAAVLIDEHRGLLPGRGSRYIDPEIVLFKDAGCQT